MAAASVRRSERPKLTGRPGRRPDLGARAGRGEAGDRRRFRLAALIAEIAANHEARVLPVTGEAARRAARLRARRAGRPAHTGDALIAGIAEAEHLVVATRNMDHFAPFGVESVNPWTERAKP